MKQKRRGDKRNRECDITISRSKRGGRSLIEHGGDHTVGFGVLVAALSTKSHPQSLRLVKQCLQQLAVSILSNPPPQILTIIAPLLSLLPILLQSRCSGIVSRSAEIIGAAALLSLEINERIASDVEVVKGLVSVLGRTSEGKVLRAACNAILDLSSGWVGQLALLRFSAVESLMVGFLQVSRPSEELVCLYTKGDGTDSCIKIGLKGGGFPLLFLDAAINFINSCSIMQVESIPRKLTETFLVHLKNLWAQVHRKVLRRNIVNYKDDSDYSLSNIRTNNLAECIFRLSLNDSHFGVPVSHEVVKRSIFGPSDSNFEDFILHHWEASPYIRRFSLHSDGDDIFYSALQSLKTDETCFPLSSILQKLVSCLPVASNDLDLLGYLKEVTCKMGCPLIYNQDIRVLKTERQASKEVHFFNCTKSPHVLYIDDLLKCEEAFIEGYTFALRGMKFRFKSIATIADGLASLFGQPSVGANLYLTPPNSQGLACHYDDHCVFVCQLVGTKQWTIFPQSTVGLPRLYEPLPNLQGLKVDCSMTGCRQIMLSEGEILYIPRGFPHKACTATNNTGPNGPESFSLHLTLGIEVEAPFQWEGFVHVALHCWKRSLKQPYQASTDSLSENLNFIVNLLHVVIRLISDSDQTFRKACLVGAISLQSGSNGWLDLNQRTIFKHLIRTIETKLMFLEAVGSIKQAVERKDDPFQHTQWLELMNQEEEAVVESCWDIQSMSVENLLLSFDQQMVEIEAALVEVKSKFCCEVLFENVIGTYIIMLDKYKKSRQQYTDGMLSLHCL